MGGASTAGAYPMLPGNCKKDGHQYQWVDDANMYQNYPGQTNTTDQKTLREVYGGRFVKHVFCQKCGDYRNLELKSEKGLKKFLDMDTLKN